MQWHFKQLFTYCRWRFLVSWNLNFYFTMHIMIYTKTYRRRLQTVWSSSWRLWIPYMTGSVIDHHTFNQKLVRYSASRIENCRAGSYCVTLGRMKMVPLVVCRTQSNCFPASYGERVKPRLQSIRRQKPSSQRWRRGAGRADPREMFIDIVNTKKDMFDFICS